MFKRLAALSPGGWVIIGLALASSATLRIWGLPERKGDEFWLFARGHLLAYEAVIKEWNAGQPADEGIVTSLFSVQALERRLLSGFLSGTSVPALSEVEQGMVGKFFSGPLDAVGFVDLTERLKAEGLLDAINSPSFAPWTTRGRIFGIPHDVHPVLLAYRADLIEAAGIDVSRIETWEDFSRVLRPLMTDEDGDGFPDRYLISVWESNPDAIEILLLQAGGEFFDANGFPLLDSEINARVIATLVTWTTGPGRIATNAPNFDAAGNQMFMEGYVLCHLMPDWLAGVWMQDLPGLQGKVKLLPLPSWEAGGRRTSVLGGTMLAISKRSPDVERHWELAKKLYLSEHLAKALFQKNAIISPVKAHWNKPFYDIPNPYFSGQRNGRLYIDAAPHVPARTSSPYKVLARDVVMNAMIRLKRYADSNQVYSVEKLVPQAKQELIVAQTELLRRMATNRFLDVPGVRP